MYGAQQSRLPAGVTAQLRTDGDSDYVFLLNFSGAVARVELDQNGYVDVESDEIVTGQVDNTKKAAAHTFGVLYIRF
ncbi:Beta-galactosidase C-terminal domain [Paenibacillus sp. FSL K6-1318]|uniref:Beta-galactosidase C-terminal domain n=1 Tax=Paenibacillus sp. FSL K6-1318 TaxID=2975291 RepID=UPI0030ECA563